MLDEKIINDLEKSYGISFTEVKEVLGGYLNEKWVVNSNYGQLFIKQFSNSRYDKKRLKLVEEALQRQISIKEKGVLCPMIVQCNDHAIRNLDDETNYMVMEFYPGDTKNIDTVNVIHMRSLGSACAMMHKCFVQLTTEKLSADKYDVPNILKNYYNNCVSKMPTDACELYKQTVAKQEKIINSLTDDFFRSLPKGIAHKDFAADNILFYKDSISAILDFDTNCYGYQWQDIGRILLSLSLKNEELNVDFVNAFISGYQEHLEMNISHVANALRLSWCIETPWWINNENFYKPTPKAARFRDEIIWVTDNWFELEYILAKKAYPEGHLRIKNL